MRYSALKSHTNTAFQLTHSPSTQRYQDIIQLLSSKLSKIPQKFSSRYTDFDKT